MRISKGRMILRIVLVLVVALTAAVVYRAWQIREPDYYWRRAEAALAAGNDARSELELRSCLARFPNHAAAHFRLAELMVRRAKAQHPGADFGDVPDALKHLAAAATLVPGRLDVQRALMTALAATDKGVETEAVAEVVHRLDPNDEQALLLVTRSALRKRDLEAAAEKIGLLAGRQLARPFTALYLAAEYGRLADKSPQRAVYVAAALQRAATIPASAISQLTRDERGYLAALLLLGVETAQHAAAAHHNVELALRFADSDVLPSLAVPLGLRLHRQFPAEHLVAADRTDRQRIEARISEIARRQIDAHRADPLVYQYLADAAIAGGDQRSAIELLKQGIAASAGRNDLVRERLNLNLLCVAQLLAAGRADEAQALIDPLLAEPTTAAQGRMLAGSTALAQGRIDDARKQFEEARQSLGDTLLIRLALATCYTALGQPANALPHLSEVVGHLNELTPQEKAWADRYLGKGLALRRALCEALLATDRVDDAAPHLAALRGTDEEPAALLALAGYHWRHQQQARAEAVLSAARRTHPDNVGLVIVQATVIAQRQRPEDGDALVAAFAAQAPDDLPRQLAAVQWRAWRGQAAEALKMLPQLKARFDQPALWSTLEAQLLLATDHAGDALVAAQQLRGQADTRATGTLIAAAASVELGRVSEAATLLDQKPDGGGPMWDLARARVLAAGGHPDAALDLLAASLHYTSVAPEARAEIGNALERIARRQGMQAALRKASQLLAASPDEPSLLSAHANLAIGAGEPDTALTDLERLDKVRPDSALVPYLRAQALLAKNETVRAAVELQVAIQRQPNLLDARLLAAVLALRKGDYAAALSEARAVMAADRERFDAYELAAKALVQLGRSQEAIAVLQRCVTVSPQSPRGYVQLARLCRFQGQANMARETLRLAANRLPREFDVLAAQVELLVRDQQVAAARELARRRVAEHPDAFGADRMAGLLLRLKQYDDARPWAEQFLATAGRRQAEAHWLLGNIAAMQGRRNHDPARLTEAADHFRRVLAASPSHFGAANNLAYLLATGLDQPQAALEMVRGLMARPDLKDLPPEELPMELIDTLATVLLRADRAAEALTLLARATGRHPDNAGLQFQLGLAQLGTGNVREAETALRNALRLGLDGQFAERARHELEALGRKGAAG